jgi:hypothetical protein
LIHLVAGSIGSFFDEQSNICPMAALLARVFEFLRKIFS